MNNRMLVTLKEDGSLVFTEPKAVRVKMDCEIDLSLNPALNSKNKVEELNKLCNAIMPMYCLPSVVNFNIFGKLNVQNGFAQQIIDRICALGIAKGDVTYGKDLSQTSVKKRSREEREESDLLILPNEEAQVEFKFEDVDLVDNDTNINLSIPNNFSNIDIGIDLSILENSNTGDLFFFKKRKESKEPEELKEPKDFTGVFLDTNSASQTFFDFNRSSIFSFPLLTGSANLDNNDFATESNDGFCSDDSSASSTPSLETENLDVSRTADPIDESVDDFVNRMLRSI